MGAIIEQLWNPDHYPPEVYMLTNFIHGCYYPSKNSFDHIDFSINQYSHDLYKKKWMDAMPETQIPIELYGEKHYKIWCIRSDNIALDIWAQLVDCSLDLPFRKYFAEAIGCSLKNME